MSDEKFLIATWPIICDDCLAAIAKQAHDRHDLSSVLVYCPHELTLVQAHAGPHEGQRAITRWQVVGPVDEAEATRLMRQFSGAENLDQARFH